MGAFFRAHFSTLFFFFFWCAHFFLKGGFDLFLHFFHTFFEIFEETEDDFQFFWLAPIKRPFFFFFEQAHFFLMGAFLMRPSGAHFFFSPFFLISLIKGEEITLCYTCRDIFPKSAFHLRLMVCYHRWVPFRGLGEVFV